MHLEKKNHRAGGSYSNRDFFFSRLWRKNKVKGRQAGIVLPVFIPPLGWDGRVGCLFRAQNFYLYIITPKKRGPPFFFDLGCGGSPLGKIKVDIFFFYISSYSSRFFPMFKKNKTFGKLLLDLPPFWRIFFAFAGISSRSLPCLPFFLLLSFLLIQVSLLWRERVGLGLGLDWLFWPAQTDGARNSDIPGAYVLGSVRS